MKNIKVFTGCILAAAMIGCTPEISDPQLPEEGKTPEETPVAPGSYELDASLRLMTRTSLDDLTVSWEEDDVIKVWTGESFTDYLHQGEGKFKGEKPVALKDGKYVAFYPVASVVGTKASFEIPAEQTFAARKANDLPMVAVWEEGGKCVFSPVCSILEMPLTIAEGVTLKSIDYAFNGNVGAGTYTYDYVDGTYTKDAAGNITLTGDFASGNVYNAVVPGDYSDGFVLTLTDTDDCAMVLTATNGGELAAGSVQPLGAVNYAQLAPEFTISYNDWAATATLASEKTSGTRYWLSKTVNGEPLTGVAPVDMSNLAKGAAVKLYGYLCSENIAGTGVQAGDQLYFVTEFKNGNVSYQRSVQYTYQPDPLEVILYGDEINANIISGVAGGSSVREMSYIEDKVAGESCIKAEMKGGGWSEFRFDLWDKLNGAYFSAVDQARNLYNFEFYIKADHDIKGNAYLHLRVVNPSGGYFEATQSAWQNYTALAKETPIPADTWTKVSIPINEFWFPTLPEGYRGYNNDGSENKYLSNFKDLGRIYFYNKLTAPSVYHIDHITIRKSTL